MKSSNLAEQLEEFAATLDSLRLTPSPDTRRIVAEPERETLEDQARPVRRASRVRRIEIRGQGLSAFRVF